MRVNADRAESNPVLLGYNRSDIRHDTNIIVSHNAQRDRILRTYRLTCPAGLHNPVTETFAHLIRVRAVLPMNLNSPAYRHETEYIITVNRITTLRQFEFQSFQVLVNHKHVLFRSRLFLRSLQVISLGTAIHNLVMRIIIPLLLLDVFVQNFVDIQCFISYFLIKLRHVLEP